ncbi:MAG: phosphate regulon sensor histidine kinase PhoR [Pseudomonadota bacterium]
MIRRWYLELWRVLLVVGAGAAVGALFDRTAYFVIAALAVVVALYVVRLLLLLHWIERAPERRPPELGGLWGDLVSRMFQLQRHTQERQRQVAGLLDQFQRSAEAMPDAAVALGRQGEIQWFNEAASTLLGLRTGRDVGQPISNLIRYPIFQTFLRDRNSSGSIEIPAPGNDFLRLSMRIIPYSDEQSLLLAQDVTERHRLEQVRKDFVANVSHELRTPLTVVSGFVENLQHDQGECSRRWGRVLELMSQQATRMQRIVDDLLLLASLESSRERASLEEVAVNTLLGEIREEMLASLPPGESRDIQVEAGPGLLRGNAMELRSAFTNLASNAVKYTPDGGRVCLRWLIDERGGILEVEDSGEGISTEHIPRLTERFYRVDTSRSRERGGTGLGLAIVKHVLQNHGARLEIESSVGKGSVFRCLFPRQRVHAGAVDRISPIRVVR